MRIYLSVLFSVCLLFAATAAALDDWTLVSPTSHPSARKAVQLAYIGGDQMLLFGGNDGSADDETWVYDLSDNTWTQKSPAANPSARYYHAMAHIGGDQVLLFGGGDGSGDNQTWVYDLSDNTWTQKSPASSPTGRFSHAMASIGSDQVLLFGGYAGTLSNQTWVYDLSDNTWTQKSPTANPSGRQYHAMAYIGDDKVALFGGFDGSTDDETWVYDLSDNTWTQQSPSASPTARQAMPMVHIGGDQVLLFGGYPYNDETWVYDLSADQWTQDTNTTQPLQRFEAGLCATSTDGSSRLVLFGGFDGGYDDETWIFGGGDYSLPVELSSFTADGSDGTVTLRWTTQSERDNMGFYLYRSEGNRRDYHRITQELIPGAGNSSGPRDYFWTDRQVENGTTYWYWLVALDIQGGGRKHGPAIATPMAAEPDTKLLPETCCLSPNYPNPFNPETWIDYQVNGSGWVSLNIYNAGGQLVRALVNEDQGAGFYRIRWDGRDGSGRKAASGLYFCVLHGAGQVKTTKMLLLR